MPYSVGPCECHACNCPGCWRCDDEPDNAGPDYPLDELATVDPWRGYVDRRRP